MKRLLALSALATALFFAQPAQAQQQNNQADSTSMNHMEMMQDSTMHNMMGRCMNMMKGMMSNMKSDSTMSHCD
ncbi:MAG TPA: hypothetical protein VFG39_01195 [Balneolaceae bacterium]|nr:hypothetical protein [Balneolaceae bacterium]